MILKDTIKVFKSANSINFCSSSKITFLLQCILLLIKNTIKGDDQTYDGGCTIEMFEGQQDALLACQVILLNFTRLKIRFKKLLILSLKRGNKPI